MNTKTLVPLSAAALFALVAGSLVAAHSSNAAFAPATSAQTYSSIVDLPAVTVRPSLEDAAYHQAHKIVDLATVTVRPAANDLAFLVAQGILADSTLAQSAARVIDMPAVTVRPSVEDIQMVAVGAANLAQQLAAR
ncbi:MAG: hypothetical protein ABIP44_10975 [Pseudoxanthomonas sp.]